MESSNLLKIILKIMVNFREKIELERLPNQIILSALRRLKGLAEDIKFRAIKFPLFHFF